MSATFSPCAVVPTFDNPLTVRSVVAAVRSHVDIVILVDDGSGPAGAAACDSVERDGLAMLRRHPRNRGKGAAVKTGFAAARELGFTHVLQVDADGQHDLGRIPAFLDAAREDADAVVIGFPVHDETIPRARRIARGVTTFWVGLELGGRDRVVDAMVGFRVYPLAAALAARARGDRMDFDVEIAVKLARAGVRVINLPVAVRYPSPEEGGVSHFRTWRDNLGFCALHSRLCMTGVVDRVLRRGPRRELAR